MRLEKDFIMKKVKKSKKVKYKNLVSSTFIKNEQISYR